MKSLSIKLMLFFTFLSTTSTGQNLVANWSFEDTIPCISNPFIGMPETAPPWESYMQSPDFWSSAYCGGSNIGPFFGLQIPKSGASFVGIGVYDSLNTIKNEVFGQELIDSLTIGHIYCVSFYVSLAEISKFGIDKIGALFTSFKPDPGFLSTFTAIPQVENPTGQFITDTLNWIQISASFVAQGGEKFISLGNFNAIGSFQTIPVLSSTTAPIFASYYYVDDISVIDCTVGLGELNSPDFSVYPNPVFNDQTMILEFSSEKEEEINIQLYSSVGQMVYQSKQLTSSKIALPVNFEPGIYFCQVESKFGISIRKIVVLGK